MKKLLEIACFNKSSVLHAQQAGADRIELSQDYAVGGTTPSEALISEVLRITTLPVHVLIRPRAGHFFYNDEERMAMMRSIDACKSLKVSAVVFGLLDRQGKIDLLGNRTLLEHAMPMKSGFHRAIDECQDAELALEQLIVLGFDSVLTSGGAGSATSGISRLTAWQKTFGDHIRLIAAGGIRSTNLTALLATGCTEYHSSALVDGTPCASVEEIRRMRKILDS